MQTRPFGNTGIEVSDIGLGCWQFGGDWGQCSDDDALSTLAAAIDSGVTFLDTADVYGQGRSESLIGRFLMERNLRGKIFVATKLGRLKGFPDKYSLALFRECTEDSLKRLGVETLDLTQLHCIPHHYLQSGEAFGWLETLQKEGKIKHYGASVESMDEALTCLDHWRSSFRGRSLQIIFNIFRQKPIDVLFAKAKAQGVALIARLPLASGVLTGKFWLSHRFDPQDHRNYNRDGAAFNVGETFAGLPFDTGAKLAERVRLIVEKHALGAYEASLRQRDPNLLFAFPMASMAQRAIRWILDHDAVSVVIPGAKDPKQAHHNAAASDLPPLPAALHDELKAFYESDVKAHIRGPY